MTELVCNLCSKKLFEHTHAESLDCAMKLIKEGRRKTGLAQHKLRQSMSCLLYTSPSPRDRG